MFQYELNENVTMATANLITGMSLGNSMQPVNQQFPYLINA